MHLLQDVRGRVVGGRRALRRDPAGRPRLADAVDTERPPGVAVLVVGDQVPPPFGRDQAMRLHVAPALTAVARPVAEAQPLAVGDRHRQDRQAIWVDGRCDLADSGTVAAPSARTRPRNREGSTCSTFASARRETSSSP